MAIPVNGIIYLSKEEIIILYQELMLMISWFIKEFVVVVVATDLCGGLPFPFAMVCQTNEEVKENLMHVDDFYCKLKLFPAAKICVSFEFRWCRGIIEIEKDCECVCVCLCRTKSKPIRHLPPTCI